MTASTMAPGVVPILPCIDIDECTDFYARLGFAVVSDHGDYRLLEAPNGLRLHLRAAEAGWVDPLRNSNGIYIYTDDVDALAAQVSNALIGAGTPQYTPWGTYEFAVSDPNGILVRVGRASER